MPVKIMQTSVGWKAVFKFAVYEAIHDFFFKKAMR
jgi:hypothetical protein